MRSFSSLGLRLSVALVASALWFGCSSSDEASGGVAGGAGASGAGNAGAAGSEHAKGGNAGDMTGDGGSDAGDSSDAPSSQCKSLDECGKCAANNCCPEMQACSADSSCLTATIKLLGCTKSFDECVAAADASGNASFVAYTACLKKNSCPLVCE